MLFKTFVFVSLFSLGFFTVMAVTGAKGPAFSSGGSARSGRGSGGYFPIWFGGK